MEQQQGDGDIMDDERLLELIKSIDSNAVRVPNGVRQIVNAVMAIEREECAKVLDKRDRRIMRRHVVTKPSDDGTFEKGDHIIFNEDGSISCVEAIGWITVDKVPSATIGMESVPDTEWAEKKKARLMAELAALGA